MIDNLETILRHRLRLIRLLDGKLLSSDCELECRVEMAAGIDIHEVQLRLSAMKLWLEDFVDGSIAYNPDTEMDTEWLDQLSNNIMMIPGEPMDHMLTAVLHAKLGAIGEDIVSVKRTHFFTDTSHGFSNAISGPTDEWLPAMSDWIGPRHFHKIPWWHRADASSIDLQPGPEDDLTVIPSLGDKLVDMMRDDTQTVNDSDPVSAEIIKPKFKPRLITSEDD